MTELPRLDPAKHTFMTVCGKEDLIETVAVIVREVLKADRPQCPNLEQQ